MNLKGNATRDLFLSIILLLALASPLPMAAQESSGWHISPLLINTQVGEVQPLQILDVRGNELRSNSWSVDSSELAEIKEESGLAVLHPKAQGVVHVVALLEGTALTAEVKIWPREPGVLIAGPHWAVPSTGRELAVLQAAPNINGPDLFTLDRNDKGTYVRALTNRGLQLWMWAVPETAGDVELVCGDNTGGAIVTVTRSDFYTLYAVGKNGKLSWSHKFEGIRKAYALDSSNLVHLVNQSVDGTSATISGWDGSAGIEKFNLKIPASYEREVNVQRADDKILCAPGRSVSQTLRTETSGIFINTDGDAYAVFNQRHWTVGTDKCRAGSVVDPEKVYFSRDDQLVLWRIQSDGSHHDSIIDAPKQSRLPFTTPISIRAPTGDILPDGFGGVLFSIRSSPRAATQKAERPSEEFVYRVTEDGELAYKFLLPKYAGHLHDEMVLGEQDLGFATRGSMLIAFSARDGNEVWRWDSGIPEITINMATGGGGCVVDTPEGLVLVEEGVRKQVLAPHGSEMYTPGLFIQDDPHGLVMLGAGIKRD